MRGRAAAGFTLIEAALTTVIVGTGVLSIMAAQQAYHRQNDWAQRTGTAILLANELRELTLSLPLNDPISGPANMGPEAGEASVGDYNDLDDFSGLVAGGFGAGTTFDPPINALRQVIPNMNGWSQRVLVENVLSSFVSATFTRARLCGERGCGAALAVPRWGCQTTRGFGISVGYLNFIFRRT